MTQPLACVLWWGSSNMVVKFLITSPPPCITEWGRLGAAASFSTPVDPISAAAEGQEAAARRQLRPEQRGNRGEGTGERERGRAARGENTAAAGGRRWMNSTPQDQSGTRSHSRSSFSRSMLLLLHHFVPAPHKPHHSTTYMAPFGQIYREADKEERGNMRGKISCCSSLREGEKGLGGRRRMYWLFSLWYNCN